MSAAYIMEWRVQFEGKSMSEIRCLDNDRDRIEFLHGYNDAMNFA